MIHKIGFNLGTQFIEKSKNFLIVIQNNKIY